MTTDVYAQLKQRVKRDHESAFDGLVAGARRPAPRCLNRAHWNNDWDDWRVDALLRAATTVD
jgi:hypothetical protein